MKAVRPPLFLTLAAAVVAVAIALPLLYLVIRTTGIGGEELWQLISRPRNVMVFFNSAAMAATVTFFSALIAIPLAFLTVRTDLPGRRFWLVATTLPLAVPSYVGSFALIATLAPRGSFLQLLLQPLGVEELPSIYGFPGTVLAITLFTYPYMLLSVRSALQGIDPSLEEAAKSLGYGGKETFFRVVLPQLKPSIIAGGLLVALYALRDFGTPSLMRFDAFTRAIFLQYKASFNRNSAAALALMLVILVLGILWLEYRMRSRAAYYSRGSASLRPPKIAKLGIWKWPAFGFCLLITSFGVALPVGVTLFWLIRGFNIGYTFPNLIPNILNSIGAAGLAALATTIFALPVAILAVRFPNKITAIIERCSYIGFGVPGIVVALSLVFFGANYLPMLYQTLPMLIFAYLVLFLPQSVGTVRSSLLQLNPQIEESARSLGRNAWQTLKEVTLPLVQPGILSGAVLVFLTAIKELPATILLAPIGFTTLAMQIWQATENVDFADAAAASLAMLLVSIGSTLLVLSQDNVKKEKIINQVQIETEF
ncbi:iron ABC transporter permease [Nostoc linckia z18]|uniref:Iron ABC transporter permease n=2 Tax=Nostoc linckia TaxID=92942 RepID=A0A9Q5ZCY5_NOSLI|nr:iron ABC transporter permease [Nostoc linckia]PHK32626.1 iron ABC transporter permease [Nostoc linckia z15]PHK45376.1 iron ABC transporter permease [Nostoc linckia z16]PHJ59245.1 iron ABC transporter permease [Nostoc linckia z1]PHJ69735.1 iron ABC transporter permease [Nostoc linckia z2]PHJ72316.1 iron ABC transporter permease [Nostoc linckia z3]